MNYRVRMQASHRRQLQALLSDRSREQACFLLCRSARADDETVLLVVDVMGLEAGDLNVQRPDQLSVAPSAMLRVARAAQESGTAVCMVHTHPFSLGSVGFSHADDVGNVRTFEFFHRMVPERLHSCLVWSGDLANVSGRVYRPDGNWLVVEFVDVVSGEKWHRHRDRAAADSEFDREVFDRQARLLGRAGQATIGELKVGVIGCGGIGTVCAQLLVHSGVRDFLLVDFDPSEPSNLPRLLGATADEVNRRALKTAIVERCIKAVNPQARVRRFESAVEDSSLLGQLVDLDAIVCATDDTTSRAYLNQLCHQYYVPILDLGVQFVVDQTTGQIVNNIGKVNLMRPGDPCLQCIGHVNPHVLADEALDMTAREDRRQEGYLRGTDEPEPAMMIFNMQVASRGVQTLLSWFSGFQPVSSELFERYDFLGLADRGLVSATRRRAVDNCVLCDPNGTLHGVGDAHPMIVSQRPR